MDDKVVNLGVKFKKQPNDDKMFTIVRDRTCLDHAYVIDTDNDEISCSKCKKLFSPMAALIDLARKESQWHYNHEKYKMECERLDKKQRTKCQHCHKMTKIK